MSPVPSPEPLIRERVEANDENLVQLIRRRAMRHPDQRVFAFLGIDGEIAVTRDYRQLDSEARSIAAWLQARTAPGDRVLLMFAPGIEFVSAFLGCLYAGVIAVPLFPPRPNRTLARFQAVTADAGTRIALTTSACLKQITASFAGSSLLNQLVVGAIDIIPNSLAEEWREPDIEPTSIAFLQYTSGSTADPKGVMISHGNLMHNQRMIVRGFRHDSRSVILSWLPLYHDLGLIGSVIQPLFVGCQSILMSPVAFLQRPVRWLQAISKYRATSTGGPNFAYDLCARRIPANELGKINLSTWTVAVNGAEPIRADTLRRFTSAFSSCGFRMESFHPCYGMAESTLLITVAGGSLPMIESFDKADLERNLATPSSASHMGASELTSSGVGHPDQRLIIVDPVTRQPCADLHVGEIWVASPSVGLGYWQRDELNASHFRASLAGNEAATFLRTGDLGFMHAGALFVTGRLKDLIIIRGRNIYPQDIENIAGTSHPSCEVGGGAAFTIDTPHGEGMIVVQELARGAHHAESHSAILDAIRQTILHTHEVDPFAIVLLKAGILPKTSSGKVRRQAARAEYLAQTLASVAVWKAGDSSLAAPQLPLDGLETSTHIEEWMVAWIAARLGMPHDAIDPTKPFVAIGLDSLAMMEMGGELEKRLGRSLQDIVAWDYPSIRLLSQFLAGNAPKPTSLLESPTTTCNSALEQLVGNIEQMSDADALAALSRESPDCTYRSP